MGSKTRNQGTNTPADDTRRGVTGHASTPPGKRQPGAPRTRLGGLAQIYIDNWRALDQVIPRIYRAAGRTARRRVPGRGRRPMAPVPRARALLREMDAVSYDRFRSHMELQRILLRPPDANEQRPGGQPRIVTSAPNPAQIEHDDPPRELVFTIQDQTGADAGQAGMRCHWYLQPMRWDGMPDVLGDYPRVELAGGRRAYDLGTGKRARFPAAHEGLYVVICQREDAQGRAHGTLRYLQSVLERRNIEQLEMFERYLARVDEIAARIAEPRVPIAAVHVNERIGQASPLRLFLGRSRRDPDELLLADMTLGLDPEEHRLVYTGATIEALLADFARHSGYPRGTIALRIPPNELGIAPREQHFASNGNGLLGTLSARLGWLALALNAGVLLASPFLGGRSRLIPGLLLSGGITSIAASTLALVDHAQNADLHELGITLDITGIALGLLSTGVAIQTLRTGQRRGGNILLWSSIAVQGASGLLILAEGSDRLTRILRNRHLSRDEKLKSLLRAIADLVLNGAILGNPPSELVTFRERLHGFLGDIAGNVSEQNQLTLAFLDDAALRGLHDATAQDLTRLAAMLREDPSLVGRIAGRQDLLRALRMAGGDTASDLDLALSRLSTDALPP